jgi:hypothetical protein
MASHCRCKLMFPVTGADRRHLMQVDDVAFTRSPGAAFRGVSVLITALSGDVKYCNRT